MGHIFGAPHDGDSGIAQSCLPQNNYIMGIGVPESLLFSSCSIKSFKAALLNTNLKYNTI